MIIAELIAQLNEALQEEAVGLVGGGIFLFSWILQAWESRRAGTAIVSIRFFVLRFSASALLTFEGVRSQSLSITLVMGATAVLMLYNVYLLIKGRKGSLRNGTAK